MQIMDLWDIYFDAICNINIEMALSISSYLREAIYIGKTVTKDLKKSAAIG